jgi:ankyrin repeat protein
MRYSYVPVLLLVCWFFACNYCSSHQDILREKFFHALKWASTEPEALEILNKAWDYITPDERDWTPLQLAIFHNRLTVIKKLLEKLVPVNTSSGIFGWRALHIAARYNNRQALQLLLQAQADIHARDAQGNTALHYTVTILNPSFLYKSDLERIYRQREPNERAILDFLLRKGANINAQNNEGDTLLHKAVYADRVSLVRFLLRYSAINTSLKNNQGLTPFDFAYKKNLHLALLLLKHKILTLCLENLSPQLPQEIMLKILKELWTY